MEIKGKVCSKCGESKPLSEFPVRKEMADGHRNECTSCRRKLGMDRYFKKAESPNWLVENRLKNKLRMRENSPSVRPFMKKGHEKSYSERFPEKIRASKASAKLQYSDFPPGQEKHHWSYRKEHWLDVIFMSVTDHRFVHKFLVYDQELKMYRSIAGELLDSKSKHQEYIQEKLQNKQKYNGIKRSNRHSVTY